VLITFAAPGLAASKEDGLKTYKVTGVFSSDPPGLNVRDNVIEAQSLDETHIVGHLAWNAKGIVSSGLLMEIGNSIFRQIRAGELVGWVNEKYLSVDTMAVMPKIRPEVLTCSGSEPFWSLKLSITEPRFSGADLENGEWIEEVELETMASHSIVELGPENWSVTLKYQSKSAYFRTIISKALPMCTDSMSSVLYPYQIIALKGDVPRPVYGCCQIDIDRK
jgi:uncharacterized membrane protein